MWSKAASGTTLRGDGSARMIRLGLSSLAPILLAAQTAHFHHLHLNSTDPAAAIQFYTSRFNAEKARFDGKQDAVWAQKSWLLFNKVSSAPAAEFISSIWHFGWGAEDMQAEYKRQLDLGTKFDTPITDLGPKFFFAYVDGPDKALIEINTAAHHDFGHLHLFAVDPVTSAEWYMKHFGLKTRNNAPLSREPRTLRNTRIGAITSLMADNVNVILFPLEYAERQYKDQWKDRSAFVSTKGRVVDHVAFSVDDLASTLERMKADGVKIVEAPKAIRGTQIKSAFIEGPDQILIELVEGHATKQ
jgi:catechol 2,3-dioxygenase-like lactoylglutathione lyase family enzyme